MPDLDPNFFKGKRDLTLAEVQKLETLCSGDPVTLTLHTFGWAQGDTAVGVIITLTPDNANVASSELFARRPILEQTLTYQAAKIWLKADKSVTFNLQLPDSEKFVFASGGVFSEYLASQELSFSFSRAAENGETQKIPRPEWNNLGISDFCIRLIGQFAVRKATNKKAEEIVAKFTVLIFPENRETLDLLADATQDPSWPGIKLKT